MRISCDRDDPGYVEYVKLRPIVPRVFLDGVEIKEVITADEEAGMLIRYLRGMDGLIRVEKGIAVREVLYGRVELH